MKSGKADNQLNLALDMPETERAETLDLNVGFDPEEKTWELIVKYNGDLDRVSREVGFLYSLLLNGYAILEIGDSKVPLLSRYSEIEFIEKPMQLFYEVAEARAVSCILPLQTSQYNLYGEGVIVAVVDSGIDYAHPDFRNEDGTTRILALWDQSIRPETIDITKQPDGEIPGPPEGFVGGTVFSQEKINQALQKRTRQEQLEIVPSVDLSGHGTHVTGIAAGNGRASQGRYRGVAPRSDLLIVKLGNSLNESFPRTTQLMTAIDYVIREAIKIGKPLAINISFGNNYGSHDGNSILEQYINDASNIWKTSIVIGTGNEGAGRTHTAGILDRTQTAEVELVIAEGQRSINLQIWKNYYDRFDVTLIHPSGNRVGPIPEVLGKQQFQLERTNIFLYYGEPKPINRAQEIYIEFTPVDRTMSSGIWKIQLTPRRILTGNYDMWLPTTSQLSEGTGFNRPVSDTTLTIPSAAASAISVGAYDSNLDSYAFFSGRGFTRGNNLVKPDIVAPGVDINAPAPGGGYTIKSGTSMATPFVTGSAAIMMEWGIVNNNDPYLYGEKIKAYLISGARRLPGFSVWPNQELGYGALCLRDSLPL
ncbi:MAG: peptidase S8 [Lachnospiraceae bacterium]|nr:peptidase S8 [Lachnospiraceae bacterium]